MRLRWGILSSFLFEARYRRLVKEGVITRVFASGRFSLSRYYYCRAMVGSLISEAWDWSNSLSGKFRWLYASPGIQFNYPSKLRYKNFKDVRSVTRKRKEAKKNRDGRGEVSNIKMSSHKLGKGTVSAMNNIYCVPKDHK